MGEPAECCSTRATAPSRRASSCPAAARGIEEIPANLADKAKQARHEMIETLAENIANEILRQYKKVNNVLVTVHKPKAPIKFKFKDVQVQIEVKR